MKRYLIIFSIILSFTFSLQANVSDETFETMRKNLREKIVLGKLDYDANDPLIRACLDSIARQAAAYHESMIKNPTDYLWTDLNYLVDEKEYTPYHVHKSYKRLHTMTLAWAYPSSPFYHDSTLLADIKTGLDFLYKKAFNENTPITGNWWEWRIGIPTSYAHIVSALYEELTPEQIKHYELGVQRHVRECAKTGNLTFANQASICRNLLFMGILTGNEQDVMAAMQHSVRAFVDETTIEQRNQAQEAYEQIVREQSCYQHDHIVWKKEGFYEDGTFIQHVALPYIGTYGTEEIEMAADMVKLFKGTNFTVPEEIVNILPTWIDKAYLPAIYKGEMMLMFMGRGVSRNPYNNAGLTALNIYESLPILKNETDKQRITNICKEMFTDNTHFSNIYGDMDMMVDKPRIDALMIAGKEKVETPFNIVLAAGDRVIHQTKDFRFGLAMSSNRIGKFEAMKTTSKAENQRGWYSSEGMTYIYTDSDRSHYYCYFDSINSYRIPGTTVDLIPREEGNSSMILFNHSPKAPDIARAGGVMLRGLYGTACMQTLGSVSDIVAKKSWFMFDNEVVCLGADINLQDEREVITTIENRRTTLPLLVNGRELKDNHELTFKNPHYAYLTDLGGYFFPQHCTLHTNATTAGYTELYLSHGTAPQGATYQYVLLPTFTEGETKAYAKKPDVKILANNNKVQAVTEKALGITGINFWAAGKAAGIESDGKACVMKQKQSDTMYLSISEPTWKRSSQTIILDRKYSLVSAQPAGIVTVSQNKGKTILVINTTDRMGMTLELVLHAVKNGK
ncbi:MAG: polysaccharide lyase 8 family protein [Bacteroidales bacterium]|nr:polysaccharide lyase 8 family protein [Bacteroidales bacterium]